MRSGFQFAAESDEFEQARAVKAGVSLTSHPVLDGLAFAASGDRRVAEHPAWPESRWKRRRRPHVLPLR